MLIGLNGRLRAGKDTAYERLSQLVTVPVERRAFADPLKDSAAALFDPSRGTLERMKMDPEPTIKVRLPTETPHVYIIHSFTGRQYLERYGTESHRDIFGETFWLDQALPLDLDHERKVIVFTDCRFVNEVERLRSLGGTVWEIVGPEGREGNFYRSDSPLDASLIDFTIDNTFRDDEYLSLDEQLKEIMVAVYASGLLV